MSNSKLNNYSQKLNSLLEGVKTRRRSDTVFCIGGGPSLLHYLPDKTILYNKDILVANNAYKLFPDCLLCHFMDWNWYLWNKEELKNFQQPLTSCTDVNRDNFIKADIPTFFKGSPHGTEGLVIDDYTKLEGHNTGHQLINIAYHLEYKNVILIGYDCVAKPGGQTQWHKEHKTPTNQAIWKTSMIPGFNKIKQDIDEFNLDFNVYNVNLESEIKCFEFTDLQKWI